METVRWGIIGCGDVCERKSGPALYQTTGSELVAVMRRDRAKAEAFAERHGAKRAYDTVDALLADPDVNAVYIATPPYLHAEQTFLAARAGKHILVEKPMAMNTAECEEMVSVCKDAGVPLHVAYYRRFYPKFIQAKTLLEEQSIGTLLGAHLLMTMTSATTGWRVEPAISGGGHFVDVGSHRLDMLLHLLGDVAEVHGFAENRLGRHQAENDVALTLKMKNGILASAQFHFQTTPARDILEIYGSDGTITLDPFDGDEIIVRKGNEKPAIYSFPTPSPVHLPFIQALVDVYNGSPITHITGEEGTKTTSLIDAALSQFRTNRIAAASPS
jgi:predicted dehydrogenase